MEPNLVTLSPFETDIAAQPDGLREFARGAARPELAAVLQGQYDRVIFTGMGSSHFAALPSWRRLVAGDYRTWWVDTGQLLDSERLITPATLLIVTSQSGASGEITALLEPDARTPVRPRAVVGITNEAGSPLAEHADAIIALRCGAEATVSTKSYLNSLAAHQHLLHVLTGAAGPAAPVTETPVTETSVTETADLIENLGPVGDAAGALARVLATASNPRVAYIGSRDHAATALYAGLITKEAAKIAAEGFIGGQFRHGPLELAGPGLAAVLFGAWAGDTGSPLAGLAADLIGSGADVTLVGDLVSPGARTIAIPRGDTLPELAAGAVVAQHVAVAIARGRGIEPGAFAYGRKVTTTL
jgi:glutamine---fructose-6-phosphate transaminase (isomerizing)